MLSRLFRRLFLEGLTAAHQAGRLEFFADQTALAEPPAFQARLAALHKVKWVVYAKRPFGGPDAVLAYLSRYTHRIAIANSRLLAFDGVRVTFNLNPAVALAWSSTAGNLFNHCVPDHAGSRRRGGSSWRPLRYFTRA